MAGAAARLALGKNQSNIHGRTISRYGRTLFHLLLRGGDLAHDVRSVGAHEPDGSGNDLPAGVRALPLAAIVEHYRLRGENT
jgi:hypothetical protein